MRRSDLFLLILIIVLILLIFFFPWSGWDAQKFLLFKEPPQTENTAKLILENQALKAELAQLRSELTQFQNAGNQLSRWSPDYLSAFVNSRYPFNLKSEILISAGRNQGTAIGQTAVVLSQTNSVGSPLLVGRVEKVFDNNALVETIFDGRFQTAVRIGSAGIEALFKGGSQPKLTLIPKNAEIKNGEIVYSAGADFPYGLAVGTVRNIKLSSDQFFQEAELDAGFNPNDLGTVLIVKNYDAQ